MSKFTPTPWILSKEIENTRYQKETHADFPVAAIDIPGHPGGIMVFGPNWVERQSNVKLISKSPEMYDYIKNISMVLKTVYDGRSSFAGMVEDYINQAQNLLKEIDGD